MTLKRRRWVKILWIVLILAVALGAALLLLAHKQNRTADITDYAVRKASLPDGFEGMLIAQVSDYHGDNTCKEQILQSLRKRKPEVILITGDYFDSDEEEKSMDFAAQLAGIAPTYYVTGNHEAMMENFPEAETHLRSMDITVLRNEAVELVRGKDAITIAGADDEALETEPDYAALCANEGFTLLMSHRPELMEDYANAGADLVFSGHAHGGQFRIPGTNQGLIAHGPSIFPKYTQGVHEMGNTTMVISRGIGNVHFPPRLFNPPELVYVTLHCAE